MTVPNVAERPIDAFCNADARSDADRKGGSFAPAPNGEFTAIEPLAILFPSNIERFGQFARPIGEPADWPSPAAPVIHLSDSAEGREGPNQNATRFAFLIGYYIQALVHAVDEIDVGTARRPEQHIGARCAAARGVRGQVLEAKIRFGLDNGAGSLSMQEHAAEQIACYIRRRPLKKGKIERFGLLDQPAKRKNVFYLTKGVLFRSGRNLTCFWRARKTQFGLR